MAVDTKFNNLKIANDFPEFLSPVVSPQNNT